VLNRDYPVVFATLYIFSLVGLGRRPDLRPDVHLDRSAHRFRERGRSDDASACSGGQSDSAPEPMSAVPPSRTRWLADQPAPLANFKANRRGYWSLWMFLVLFVLSLFAEFIANDRPILASYKGELLFPVVVDYPEDRSSAASSPETDYRDPVHRRRDQGQWLDALAADPLFLPHRIIYLPTPAPSRRPGC
jgi:hypothetical protein